ncbi:3-dehydroshikimate dehydratase [Geopyxis carbonaria]|nr:3-dehydroshikimate dehydratase [Geopyxis carbonaria]
MSSKIPLSYATPSLGMHPTHTLPKKLAAISAAGFDGIELGFDDLRAFAHTHLERSSQVAEDDWPALVQTAQEVKRMCEELNLVVLVLQPFSGFEGYDGERKEEMFRKAKHWGEIMDALGCEMLQVGSNDDPESSADRDTIAEDLRELADLLTPKKIAYENWAWGAHINTWEDIWDIVSRANRENLGMCLDTFQTAGREWADPTKPDGKVPNAETLYRESMERLERTIPKEKIFFFQISDAYKMTPPMEDAAVDGAPPRSRWSHGFRPLPYNGGYLPMNEMVKAVLGTGFRGWFSVEVFLEEEHSKEWAEGLEEKWAADGMKSVKRLLEEQKT